MHIRFLNEDLARLETESLNLLFGYGLAAEELLNLSAARQASRTERDGHGLADDEDELV